MNRAYIALGAGGFVAGGACGILVGLAVGQRRFQRQLDEEVASVKAHYNNRLKTILVARDGNHTVVVETTVEEPAGDAGTVIPGEVDDSQTADRLPSPVVVRHPDAPRTNYNAVSARTASTDEENIVHHPAERSPDEPYVISKAEFFDEHNDDYQKLSITYYFDGDVLADDKDVPIADLRGTVGENIQTKMGKMSDDPFIVYIRNDRLQIDFEVAQDNRSYSEVVLGYGNPKSIAKRRIEPS